MQAVPVDDYCPHHLSTVASTSKVTTPNGNITGEWAILVNVSPCCRSNATSLNKHPRYNVNSIDSSRRAAIHFRQISMKRPYLGLSVGM